MPGLAKAKVTQDVSLSADSSNESGVNAIIDQCRYNLPIGIGIFVFALACRLWFNFGLPHLACATSCDGFEYLTNAANLQIF